MRPASMPRELKVLVRGWLQGNVIALVGDPPTIVDGGYHTGADELVRWFEGTLGHPIDGVALGPGRFGELLAQLEAGPTTGR